MKAAANVLAGLALLLVVGCATDGRYPISGEECGPDDPVKTMSAPLCPETGV
ncbi:hypothetical protein [Oricola cellulosilytica]|uniref:hypothetical protein n=1 Tax=Oricola cellulosilytica TaxID=1429082 RepID=UPI001304B492|nr:hypothetical protein [Oricola cellulosilytica]